MSEKSYTVKPQRRRCRNCGTVMTGFRNAEGVLKLRCHICGMEEVGRKVGRRHERCDFYIPPGNDMD